MEQMDPSMPRSTPAAADVPPGGGAKKWIVIAVVVIVLIAALAWWFYAGRARETSQEIAPGQTLVGAPEGRVVSQFPEELILENSPEVLASYRIEYIDDEVSQPFVRYMSGMTFAENVELFRNYFAESEWEMLRLGHAEESPATFFYGAKGDAKVNVVLSEEEGRVEVSIAYLVGN